MLGHRNNIKRSKHKVYLYISRDNAIVEEGICLTLDRLKLQIRPLRNSVSQTIIFEFFSQIS